MFNKNYKEVKRLKGILESSAMQIVVLKNKNDELQEKHNALSLENTSLKKTNAELKNENESLKFIQRHPSKFNQSDKVKITVNGNAKDAIVLEKKKTDSIDKNLDWVKLSVILFNAFWDTYKNKNNSKQSKSKDANKEDIIIDYWKYRIFVINDNVEKWVKESELTKSKTTDKK